MIKWRVNPQEVTKARKILGLQYPVRSFRLRMRKNEHRWGEYDLDKQGLHRVYVNSTIGNPIDVSWTYWHELAHAKQCERDYNGDIHQFFADVWAGYLGADVLKPDVEDDEWHTRFYDIPFESEAEEVARRYAVKYPLIHQVRVLPECAPQQLAL